MYTARGLAGPAEVAEISGVPYRSLFRWAKTKPFTLEAVLDLAARVKRSNKPYTPTIYEDTPDEK